MQGGTMTRRFLTAAAALLTPLALPLAAHAQMPASPACAAPIAPDGVLAPWSASTPLTASGDPRHLAPVTIGRAVDLTVLPTPQVKYASRPEKPGGSVSFGGLIGIAVAQAGTYRVALSSGAWIDVLREGKPVASTAHGHGPECSGVRKMVDFALTPGRYTLQIAANGEPAIKVLVARLP
jgi:hypothetical protein